MLQQTLFIEDDGCKLREQNYPLGNGLYLEFHDSRKRGANLYRHDCLIQVVELSNKVATKLFIVDVVKLGAQRTKLAEALGISLGYAWPAAVWQWLEGLCHQLAGLSDGGA